MTVLASTRFRSTARRGLRWCLVGCAVLTLGVLPGCSEEKPPNLVLITVDTLRPDRLSMNGNARPTSPTIDALAAEGVVFPNAYSQSGWTLPSVATILTGHYPKDHGATDFHWSLDMRLPTLPGILRRAGYETHGYVSHVMLTPTYGIGDGFSTFDSSVLNVGHPHDVATARQLTDLALAGLGAIEQPYFLWVHYFDPHFEYLSHPAFASFGDDELARYDGEIAHTDYYISRLLRRVSDDNTVIVFTSDHGEEFGEHGGQYHYTLHEEVMRVPLVIKAPGLAPGVRPAMTDQVDLLPTLLGLLGIQAPPDLPGRDLFAAPDSGSVGGVAGPAHKPVYIERDRPPPYRQQGVVAGTDKLFVVEMIDSTQIPESSRGTYITVENVEPGIYMYDLSDDPAERNNIYNADDPRALELLGMITEHFKVRRYAETNVEIDEELKKKLRSLGYIR